MKKLIIPLCLIITFGVIFTFGGTLSDTYHFSQGSKDYDNGSYTGAIDHFMQLSNKAVALHNTGNSFYQVGKNQTGALDQYTWYSSALGAYSGALLFGENIATRKNYEFLKKLLEPEEPPREEEEQNKQTEQTQQQNNEKESEQQESQSTPEQSGSQQQEENNASSTSQERGEQYALGNEDSVPELTQSEKKQLEQYIESLKQEQLENQRYFGKEQQSTQRNFFEGLIGNPFFRDEIGEQEKDW